MSNDKKIENLTDAEKIAIVQNSEEINDAVLLLAAVFWDLNLKSHIYLEYIINSEIYELLFRKISDNSKIENNDTITNEDEHFRNFIRSYQLTKKWEEYIKLNPIPKNDTVKSDGITTKDFLETKKLTLSKDVFEGYKIPYSYLNSLLEEYAQLKLSHLHNELETTKKVMQNHIDEQDSLISELKGEISSLDRKANRRGRLIMMYQEESQKQSEIIKKLHDELTLYKSKNLD